MIPSWSTASIRVRMTAWYTIVLLLMMVLYATATFLAVRHEFFEQFDDQLHDDFESAEVQVARVASGAVAPIDQPRHDFQSDEDRVVDAWSATGQQIYQSHPALALPTIGQRVAFSQPRYDTVDAGGQRWRTLLAASTAGGDPILLRVGRSEERLRKQLREILVVLALGLPLVVALAAVGGYALARQALTPIGDLASKARRITADRLHERVSVPNQHDEIGRLAAVINDTLARLESSFEQLRRFTADASHELRTPLSVIRGIGEVGLSETRTPTEYKEAMGSMLEEVDRLTTLVDTLLRLSHADAGTVRLSRASLDLGQLTRDVVSSLAVLADERQQRLDLELADGVPIVADRQILREAIANLVDNAIKYGAQASTIHVRVWLEGDKALFTVADEGPGIAPEHRERIFDRFFRLDEGRSRESGGTGLGLAIAKWAVEVNGGEISVDSGANGGALFRIVLPVHSAPSAHLQAQTTHSQGRHS